MAKLRLGVIGAGSWAVASHLPNLERHADAVEFAAVSRLGREPLERIRKRFGFQIASEDYHDVINAGIDICVVSSPSGFHYEHTKAALEAGAHILVEKPVTIDPKQAWDLVEMAKRLKRHVVVSFGWNYKPMVRSQTFDDDRWRHWKDRAGGDHDVLADTRTPLQHRSLSRRGSRYFARSGYLD